MEAQRAGRIDLGTMEAARERMSTGSSKGGKKKGLLDKKKTKRKISGHTGIESLNHHLEAVCNIYNYAVDRPPFTNGKIKHWSIILPGKPWLLVWQIGIMLLTLFYMFKVSREETRGSWGGEGLGRVGGRGEGDAEGEEGYVQAIKNRGLMAMREEVRECVSKQYCVRCILYSLPPLPRPFLRRPPTPCAHTHTHTHHHHLSTSTPNRYQYGSHSTRPRPRGSS